MFVDCILQIFTRSELELVADLCKRYDVMCLSDEVYEWLVYSGSEHIKIGKYTVCQQKCIVCACMYGMTL